MVGGNGKTVGKRGEMGQLGKEEGGKGRVEVFGKEFGVGRAEGV